MTFAIGAVFATLVLAASLLWIVAAGSGRLTSARRDQPNAFAAHAMSLLNGEPSVCPARSRARSRRRG